jgi:hypothetical protein
LPTIILSPLLAFGTGPEKSAYLGVYFTPVAGAKSAKLSALPLSERFFKRLRVERFAAYAAAHKVQGNDLVPRAFQKMLKLYGLLRTDTPALATAGAQGRVVPQGPARVPVLDVQSRCRAVFDTGETAVAAIIDSKKGHLYPFHRPRIAR